MFTLIGVVQSAAIYITVFAAFLRAIAHYLKSKQAELLYYPNMPPDSREVCPTPADYGLTQYSVLDIKTPDGVTLKAYYIPCETRDSVVTLIHFHGNAGNIGHRVPQAQHMIRNLKVNVVLAEYRGYGSSDDATVCEEGLKVDAQAVLDHVRSLEYVNPDAVVVHGSSLGGAVGIHLASEPRNKQTIAALILENTFTSISDMTDCILTSILRNVRIPPRRKKVLKSLFTSFIKPLVLMLHWRSIDAIQRLETPVLFVSGTQDELVPPAQMSLLYSMCKSSEKKLACIDGGTHNDTFTKPLAMKEMKEFLELHVRVW